MLHKKGQRKKLGDDGGCFAAALLAVRTHGGVLEHPRGSRAWKAYGIPHPPREGGWIEVGGNLLGWTCEVYQGSYGHRALKPTWLYYFGPTPPVLKWGKPAGDFQPVSAKSFRSKADREAALAAGWTHTPRLSKKERAATPPAFRDLLIKLAREARLKDLW